MIVDLLQIEPLPYQFSDELQPDAIGLDEEAARLISPVKVNGTISKADVRYLVEGSLDFQMELDCTRCLETVDTDQTLKFKASYVSPEDYGNSADTELTDDDLEVSIVENSKIDLTELVREQVLLNLPTRFLCKEDCQGLCPKCGKNKNKEGCSCEEKEIDPRWEALKKLK